MNLWQSYFYKKVLFWYSAWTCENIFWSDFFWASQWQFRNWLIRISTLENDPRKKLCYKKVLFWYQTTLYQISNELRIFSPFCWKLTIVWGGGVGGWGAYVHKGWKPWGGGSRSSRQNCQGVPLFCVLLHFYNQVFCKFDCWVPLHPRPPLCIYGGWSLIMIG
jgi:hypothetical protein